MRTERWRQPAALAILSVLLVGAFWIVPYLPTTDGPEWIFATHAENHYGDPGAPYADALIPTLQFASRGMSTVYGPFEAWLGWQRGLQVALSVIVLAAAWGFVALVRAVDRERWPLGLLGFPLALTWGLYVGLWPFVVASALGLFILALAVRLREPTWRGRLILSFLLLAEAVAHVFGAVLTGGVVLLLAMVRAPRGKRRVELGKVALTGAPSAAVLAATAWLSMGVMRVPLARDFARFPWRDAAAAFPRTIAPGPIGRALVVSAAVLAAAVVAGVRARRAETSGDDRALGVAAILLLVLGALAPFQIPGWQFFSQRFVPLGVALAVVAVPLERASARARPTLAWLCFAAASAWLGTTYPFHERLRALCPDAVAGLATTFRTTGHILAVSLRPTEQATYDDVHAEVPFMDPLLHMGTLYSVVLGGVPALSFSGVHAIHAFERRPSPRPLPNTERYAQAVNSFAFGHDAAFHDTIESELASYGMFYDEVVVFGAMPRDFALWHDRGYSTDYASTATLIAHFEPCTIDLEMEASAASRGPIVDARVGEMVLMNDVRPSFTRVAGDRTHAELAAAPCGHVVVRVRWEPVPGEAVFCRNANARGELRARISRESRVVTCEGP